MRRTVVVLTVVVGVVAAVVLAQDVTSTAPAAALHAPRGASSDEPIFVRWLDPALPGDQVIRAYWERVDAGTATPSELVDFGTMLFHRGFPKDAVRMLRRAVEGVGASDPPPEAVAPDVLASEAYFRIGLIHHKAGDWRAARRAYDDCLDILTGHGWCNFYQGRLAEQEGRPAKAIDFYRRAFKFAPALADPQVNPEVLYAKLDLAALMPRLQRSAFIALAPLAYLEPERVAQVMAEVAPPPVEPPPVPTPAPTPVPAAAPEQIAPRAGGIPAATPEPAPATAEPAPTPVPTEDLLRSIERLRSRQRPGSERRPPRLPGQPEPTPPPP